MFKDPEKERLYQKEYQRKRANRLYEDFKKRRRQLFRFLGGRCFLCSLKATSGFHLHHTEYDKKESRYPRNSKSMITRLKRLKEAEEHPERFAVLCPKHHSIIECLKRFNKDKELNKLNLIIYAYRSKLLGDLTR